MCLSINVKYICKRSSLDLNIIVCLFVWNQVMYGGVDVYLRGVSIIIKNKGNGTIGRDTCQVEYKA